MPIFYSLLRFVPDPAREEFVNLAAIAGDTDSGQWDLRQLQSFRRASAIDDRSDPRLQLFEQFLSEARQSVDCNELWLAGGTQMSLELLDAWSRDLNNNVRVTPPRPIAAESVDGALDLVFDHLLLEPSQRSQRIVTKSTVQKRLRAEFVKAEVPARSDLVVRSGAYENKFDFVVHNGKALQLTQCWSFQISESELIEQLTSWAWKVHEIKERNGVAVSADGSESIEVPGGVEIVALYVPPADTSDAGEAMAVAEDALSELDVQKVEVGDAETIALAAQKHLAAAHSHD